MMGAATLQPPKSGRSRFSKALPAPPSLPALPTFEFDSQFDLGPLVSEEKPLPRPEPQAPLPPVPPPKATESDRGRDTTMAAAAMPLNSPLPPVPPKLTGPPPRSIPRRPVAAPVTPVPALVPPTTPGRSPSDPSPSPVGSISDFLSAYSDDTEDSTRPSLGAAKEVAGSSSAYAVVSPNLDTQRTGAQAGAPTHSLPPLSSDQDAQPHGPSGQVLSVQGDLPPPPPVKDTQRSISRPQTPTGLQTQATPALASSKVSSPLTNGSPQHEQLWRRRSPKADKSLAVSDLKLVSSHGSTAASAQNTSLGDASSLFSEPFPLPPRNNNQAPEPAPPSRVAPRVLNAGLPGRNVRPVPPEQTVPNGDMGQEASRIKQKMGNARRGSREEPTAAPQEVHMSQAAASPNPATSAAVSPLSGARLPTPEYGANDSRSPSPNAIVSPLSPASSPGLNGEPKPTGRKPIGTADTQLRHAKSNLSLASAPSDAGLSVRAPVGLPTSPRPEVNQTQNQPPAIVSPAPERSQGPNQPQFLPASPAPARNQDANQPQYRAYSPADQNPSPRQKQYTPYSPAGGRNQDPAFVQTTAQCSPRYSESERALAPAIQQDSLPPMPAQAPSNQRGPLSHPAREPLVRAVSETGSVETVRPAQQHQHQQQHQPPSYRAQPPKSNFPAPSDPVNLPPLREPPPTDPETTTDNPGAARFPRGWYTPKSTSTDHETEDEIDYPASPPRPLTHRHHHCLTRHRYMTANRQRTNPVACRTCGHTDRFAECYICSACSLGVCGACVGLLRRLGGELGEVLKEVERSQSQGRVGGTGAGGGAGDGIGGDIGEGFSGDGGLGLGLDFRVGGGGGGGELHA